VRANKLEEQQRDRLDRLETLVVEQNDKIDRLENLIHRLTSTFPSEEIDQNKGPTPFNDSSLPTSHNMLSKRNVVDYR
jgi:uncharacterized coiled-coil protein SlyX